MNEQAAIEARVKPIIQQDGLSFKDLNGDGILNPYEDWRRPADERAANLVSLMTMDEKIGLMLINSRPMGLSQKDKNKTSRDGLLDEEVREKDTSIFNITKSYGTTYTINHLHLRHFILRENPEPADLARWINALNEAAEETRLGIPVIVASNSRNENADIIFGMNDSIGVFSTWPGTLGLTAAAKGDIKQGKDAALISEFAETARKEWDAAGLKKGYMYMADVMTDPRWQRSYGTFGEDPEFITDAIVRLIEGFQGTELSENSVALTIKHFPGGGPRENGFDPHYEEGKWNVYPTAGSLEKYHLPPFIAASKAGASSMMPYYSIPSREKSVPQTFRGDEIPFEEVGFAFNQTFMQDVLREQLGFKGYINSDSGIIDNMAWGVEDKPTYERAAMAINAGVDIIADSNEVEAIKEAYEKGLITTERIDEACQRLLEEMFKLGLFENPYRNPQQAEQVITNPEHWEQAYKAHQKSVVLLKNREETLPIKVKNYVGKKVYIEAFANDLETAQRNTKQFAALFERIEGITLTNDYTEADVAFLYVNPKSGAYFHATPGLLELDIVENKPNTALDGSQYSETTLQDADKIPLIADSVHQRSGKVIMSVNFTLAWLLNHVEPYADALIASFDTLPAAQVDVLTGKYNPTGVLPITLPAGPGVIAVDGNLQSVSPNDVPGFDKDQFMPEGMKYAYVDSEGNTYQLNFSLSYDN